MQRLYRFAHMRIEMVPEEGFEPITLQCLRLLTLPLVYPGEMVRQEGVEPSTFSLATRHSGH